ncbi:hypothetical protein CK203_043570 [Vitis vinifera]|uniref:Uncharacterized protein n=1 Tax=Vitis vinifera TaxID=29760 RepID=A0A438HYL0_VITVI|nr:hypothetical protein CK203_043570 [Vitis vinifera]
MESRTEGSNSEVTSKPEAVHSGSANTTGGIILPITGHKLNGQNFIQWAQSVRIFIYGKGKEEYLTGAIVQPKEDDPGYRTWKLENTKEIWDAARETYSNIDNTSAIFEIKSILQDLRQGDSTVTEYFNILTRYWQQLDIYEELVWKCPEDGLLYKKVIEKERIYKFLLGLNKNLDEVHGRVLSIKPLPSVREVFSEIRREESRQKVMLGTQNSSKNLENSALVARGTQSNNNTTKRRRIVHGATIVENLDTRKRLAGIYTVNLLIGNLLGHSKTKKVGVTPLQPKKTHLALAQILDRLAKSNKRHYRKCSNRLFNQLEQLLENHTTWIVDSGASDHMTGNLMVFHEYTPCHNNSSVRIADGTLSRALNSGKRIGNAEVRAGLYL